MSTLSFPKTADDSAIKRVEAEICAVEAELQHQLASQVPLVAQIGRHVLDAGGKRLRPAFVLLSARASGTRIDASRAYRLAACMEMIHMATLMHDDVIDNAHTRRGRTTASTIFGNTGTILTGDVLLAKAMSILAEDGDLEIIRAVSRAVVELAEGEVRELQSRNRFDLSEDEHFETLRMKTASFIQCCCEVGARLGGAPAETRDGLARYGHHVGLAFQLVDDLLDYRGNDRVTGKPKATDFREGCATLPLIYLRGQLAEQEREFACSKFGNGVGDDEIMLICDWMSEHGVFERAEGLARSHIEKAKQALDEIGDTENKSLLVTAADFVVLRSA